MFPSPKNLFYHLAAIYLWVLISSCGRSDGMLKWQYYTDNARKQLTLDTVASERYIDSATHIIKNNNLSDTFWIQPRELAARILIGRGEKEKAYSIVDSCIMIAQREKVPLMVMRLKRMVSSFRFLDDEYKLAAELLKDCIAIADANGLELEKAQYYLTYGTALMELEDFKGAQQIFLKSLKILEEQNAPPSQLGPIYTNIGTLFNRLQDTSKAFSYYRKALSVYYADKDSLALSRIHMNIGTLHRQNRPDSSFYYYDQADRLDGRHIDKKFVLLRMFNRATAYTEINRNDLAVSLFDSVLKISKQENLISGITRGYYSLSVAAVRAKNLAKASQLSDSSIHYAIKGHEGMLLNACYENKINILANQKQFQKAFELSELARALGDSLAGTYSKLAIRKLENEFEEQKKELENARLNALLDQEKGFSKRQSVALIFFVLLSIVMAALYRNIKILQQEKGYAYDALMSKYISEKQSREEQFSPTTRTESTEVANKKLTLLERLIGYFEQTKPHNDPGLKRATVEEYLGVTEKELSQALREHQTRNFNAFVNHFRVEDVKRKMEDPKLAHLTIEALALEAGFGSRQNFYKVFETMTGVKPSHYRASIINGTSSI